MENNEHVRARERIDRILQILPTAIGREIKSIASVRRDFYTSLSEIRIRLGKQSSISVCDRAQRLSSRVESDEFSRLFDTLTDGALFSHRETLREGYIPLGDGVRLGVCGDFSASGELYTPTSLVFRIPTLRCERGEELYEAWNINRRGFLIYSSRGGGKTSALRTLADMISRRTELNVVAVDERYEFLTDECPCADVLRGHEKAKGIEIAKRVLGADVILVDEIGSAEEARAVLSVGRGGASVIATAHADSIEELLSSEAIRPLCDFAYFSHYAGLFTSEGERRVKITEHSVATLTV
jgi:stage III sporulation protein AA